MNTKELNQLKKLFSEQTEQNSIDPKDQKIYMDNTNVSAIVPKTKESLKALEGTFYLSEGATVPDIQSTSESVYSIEYLKILLKLLEASGQESVTLRSGNESPLIASTKEWDFYLAPRMKN